MKSIAIATSSKYPNLYPDDQLVSEYIQKQGITIETILWDKPSVKWDTFDAVIVRCTSEYYLQYSKFIQWIKDLEKIQIKVLNPTKAIQWNANKIYLLELEEKGIHIIPSIILKQHQVFDAREKMDEKKWNEIIAKPVIGAGSHNIVKITTDDIKVKQQEVDKILDSSDVIVQPLMKEILTEGEYSFIFIGGEYNHAIIKKLPKGDFVTERRKAIVERIAPSTKLIKQAKKIYETLPQPLLFARIDGLNVEEQLYLMEVEIIEPTLYFSMNTSSLVNYAKAIKNYL